MTPIEFKIKFITPLLIHGANPREADDIGLTGKALRGCWRFWFRALTGGMVNSIDKNSLLMLESLILGSSNEEAGATFRMVISPIGDLKPITDIYPSFNKGFRFSGFPADCEFWIRILPRKNMASDEDRLNVLLATIWLWGNLGGIGQRARRGFGSPVIELCDNSNHFKTLKLPIELQFRDTTAIRHHLLEGLNGVWTIFEKWLKANGCPVNVNILTTPIPTAPPYFILSSIKQIALSNESIGRRLEEAIIAVHGDSRCHEMGDYSPRNASPVFIRLHKVAGEFYAVVTWSRPKTDDKSCARKYILEKCKCKTYLNGNNKI